MDSEVNIEMADGSIQKAFKKGHIDDHKDDPMYKYLKLAQARAQLINAPVALHDVIPAGMECPCCGEVVAPMTSTTNGILKDG